MVQIDLADQWPEPVIVQIGGQGPDAIHNATEALNYLTNKWPRRRGKHHKIAREICSAAIMRQISGEAARETFLAAAAEARMTICAPEHPTGIEDAN